MADDDATLSLPETIAYWENLPDVDGWAVFEKMTVECAPATLGVITDAMLVSGAVIDVGMLFQHPRYVAFSMRVSGPGRRIAEALKVFKAWTNPSCVPCAQGDCDSCLKTRCKCLRCGGL